MGGSYAYDTANFIPGSKQSDKKITVNLEDAILEEQKLFQILESLRNNLNCSIYCDDWWDVTDTG
jgi:hypothetical protein